MEAKYMDKYTEELLTLPLDTQYILPKLTSRFDTLQEEDFKETGWIGDKGDDNGALREVAGKLESCREYYERIKSRFVEAMEYRKSELKEEDTKACEDMIKYMEEAIKINHERWILVKRIIALNG